jgi:hypothetical protein
VQAAQLAPQGYELVAKVCMLGGDLSCCSQFCSRAWELRGGGSAGSTSSRVGRVLCESPGDLEALLLCGNCYASSETWPEALGRYQAATRCAASATLPDAAAASPPTPPGTRMGSVLAGGGADVSRWAPALANAYNNMGNVLRLQHPDR